MAFSAFVPTKITLATVVLVTISVSAQAQLNVDAHKADADRLIQAATKDSSAYQRLAKLVDTFGHRHSGSASLEKAIDWIAAEMKKDGLDNVHTEPVMVNNWVRGAESAWLESPRHAPLPMLGLGHSIGTPKNGIRAPVFVVKNWADLRAHASAVKGKIVVYNVPFDTTVAPFRGYGGAVQYRGTGADSASQFGAVAVLLRSVTPHSLRSPHTGSMQPYDSTGRIKKIPAAAITVEDAEMLQRMQDRGETPIVRLTMSAKELKKVQSRNVMGEVRGSVSPNEVIVLAGHIDSWDVGQGAMDDGGGSVAAWEAVRLIKQYVSRPKRTVRVVLFTNEEIGLAGSRGYAAAHRAEADNHMLAMESDNGVFAPRALEYNGDPRGLPIMQQVAGLLKSVGVDSAVIGGPEADVSQLFVLGVPVASMVTDGSRYFWYHHSDADTIDKLSPTDMAKCVAVMAVVAHTIANMDGALPRAPIPDPGRAR